MLRRDMRPPSFYGTVPLPGDWNLVIKVKYGDILKRLNGCVIGSHFNYDLAALRSTIASVYKFGPEDELVLTYTDEDGDVVILDDDNDLRDAAISQKLNPLRIDVQLKRTPQTKQQSSNSRPLMPSVLEDQLALVKSVIDDALIYVPDEIPVILTKLSCEVRSKAASSTSSLAELLDQFAKLMTPKSGMQPFNGPADGSFISSSTGPPTFNSLKINPKSFKEPSLNSMLVEKTKSQVEKSFISSSAPPVATIGHVVPSLGSATGYKLKGHMPFVSNGMINGDLHSVFSPPRGPLYPPIPTLDSGYKPKGHMPFGSNGMINSDLHSVFSPPRGPLYPPIPSLDSIRKMNGDIRSMFPPPRGIPYCTDPTLESDGKINGDLHSIFPPPRGTPFCPAPTLGSDGKSNSELHSTFPLATISPYSPTIPTSGFNRKINGGLQTALPPFAYSPFNFSMPLVAGSYPPYQEGCSFENSYRYPSNMYGSVPQHTLHRWIQCDGCGVTPIVGPRYKSNVKHDYDLCSTCFYSMGNEDMYTRIDKPLSLKERSIDFDKDRRLQPDSSFITDVTIPDGTPMPPSTPFTKIWRMRNSGSIVWPFGTQLTWIAGDQFARQSSVKLEIPENGLHVDQEVDVSVEFVAPAKPGKHVSYWKLALPDLQKFGQGGWVSIQVVQPAQTSDCKQNTAINFNFPTEGNTTTWKPRDLTHQYPGDVTDPSIQYPADPATAMCTHALLSPEDIEAKESKPSQNAMPSAPAGEPIQASSNVPHITSTGAVATPAPETTPLPNSLIGPAPVLVSAPVPVPAPVSVPVPVHAPAPVGVPAAPSPDEITNHMEEKLLGELEGMGFSQADLNKEILRQNEYDLQKSVDDLRGFHEWDPLLDELHELGLDDMEAREVV